MPVVTKHTIKYCHFAKSPRYVNSLGGLISNHNRNSTVPIKCNAISNIAVLLNEYSPICFCISFCFIRFQRYANSVIVLECNQLKLMPSITSEKKNRNLFYTFLHAKLCTTNRYSIVQRSFKCFHCASVRTVIVLNYRWIIIFLILVRPKNIYLFRICPNSCAKVNWGTKNPTISVVNNSFTHKHIKYPVFLYFKHVTKRRCCEISGFAGNKEEFAENPVFSTSAHWHTKNIILCNAQERNTDILQENFRRDN